MFRQIARLGALALATVIACDGGPTTPGETAFTFDFAEGPQAWTAGFANYPTNADPRVFELIDDFRPLPEPLGPSRRALFLQGPGPGLFMFYKRRVEGLAPARWYRAAFEVEIATNVPFGICRPTMDPEYTVYVKVGGSPMEPVTGPDAQGIVRVTLDIGAAPVSDGRDAIALGTIENSQSCPPGVFVERRWELKTLRSGSRTVRVRSDARGGLWLTAGTHSDVLGPTMLYFTRFGATFAPD
ncbi:MAG: hypothetical protein WEB50_11040 [Vicinamibacterales bacterium]